MKTKRFPGHVAAFVVFVAAALFHAGVAAQVCFDALPVIPEALAWVRQGVATGASERNWNGYGGEVDLPPAFADWKRKLLSDPQTSGGLLVACAAESEAAVREIFRSEGFDAPAIGRLHAGAPRIRVT